MKVGDLVTTSSRCLKGTHPGACPAGIVLKLRKDGHNAGPPETAKVSWDKGGEHFESWYWVDLLEVISETG